MKNTSGEASLMFKENGMFNAELRNFNFALGYRINKECAKKLQPVNVSVSLEQIRKNYRNG